MIDHTCSGVDTGAAGGGTSSGVATPTQGTGSDDYPEPGTGSGVDTGAAGGETSSGVDTPALGTGSGADSLAPDTDSGIETGAAGLGVVAHRTTEFDPPHSLSNV